MYSDNHKYFLQFMLQNAYISTEKALEFCNAHPIESVKDLKDLKQLSATINVKISSHNLRLSFLKCEVTGEDKLALVNTANDDVCKSHNAFQPHELEYFQLLLHELVTSEERRVRKMECYNITTNTKRIDGDAIERLLETWTTQGYLAESGSHLYIGARCVAEFAPYFKAHCKDYYGDCFLCSESVFFGSSCNACGKTMHRHCADRYLSRNEHCPSCKRSWNSCQSEQANGSDESLSDEPQTVSSKRPRMYE